MVYPPENQPVHLCPLWTFVFGLYLLTLLSLMYSKEDIWGFPLISHVFGWPFLAPKRKEIPQKVQWEDSFFLDSQVFREAKRKKVSSSWACKT